MEVVSLLEGHSQCGWRGNQIGEGPKWWVTPGQAFIYLYQQVPFVMRSVAGMPRQCQEEVLSVFFATGACSEDTALGPGVPPAAPACCCHLSASMYSPQFAAFSQAFQDEDMLWGPCLPHSRPRLLEVFIR